MAPITVIPLPRFLPSGYLIGSIFGVHVLLFLSQRLKEASSKYTKGCPEAIVYASLMPNVSTALEFLDRAWAYM